MRFLRRSLVGLFLMALTLGLLAWAGDTIRSSVQARLSDEPSARPARERVFAVTTVTVEPAAIAPELTAFGELRSRRSLEIRAPAAGTLVSLHEAFEDGGRVEAGERLFQIDPADALTALDMVSTDVAEAEAELRDATRALDLARDNVTASEQQLDLRERALARQTGLRERGVGTDAAVEEAELAAANARQSLLTTRQSLATAEARLDLARTGLSRQQINRAEAERLLSDTEVFAEFSGTLGEVTAVEGGLVANNEKLADLVDPDALEVSFRISTAQYARLLTPEGRLIPAPVEIAIEVGRERLLTRGVITRESAAVGEGQTGRLLFARLEDAAGFRPGDFVTVTVEEPVLEGVVLLPATALDAGNEVLVIGSDDRLERAPVEFLRRQGDEVIVRADALAGREVVAERSPMLGAGIKVRPSVPAGEAEAVTAPAAPAPERIALDPERRARLVAFVQANTRMPAEAKERVLAELEQDEVPVQTVARIEERMGG